MGPCPPPGTPRWGELERMERRRLEAVGSPAPSPVLGWQREDRARGRPHKMTVWAEQPGQSQDQENKTRVFLPDPASRLLCPAHCRPRASGALGVADAITVSLRQGAVGGSARPLLPRGNLLPDSRVSRRPSGEGGPVTNPLWPWHRSTNPPTIHPATENPPRVPEGLTQTHGTELFPSVAVRKISK